MPKSTPYCSWGADRPAGVLRWMTSAAGKQSASLVMSACRLQAHPNSSISASIIFTAVHTLYTNNQSYKCHISLPPVAFCLAVNPPSPFQVIRSIYRLITSPPRSCLALRPHRFLPLERVLASTYKRSILLTGSSDYQIEQCLLLHPLPPPLRRRRLQGWALAALLHLHHRLLEALDRQDHPREQ